MRVILCCWLGALVSGCLAAAPLFPAPAYYTVGQSFLDSGLQQAAFDLRCPAEEIGYVALAGSLENMAAVGNRVGVAGCGRRAVYINTHTAGWILRRELPPCAPGAACVLAGRPVRSGPF